MFVEMKTTGSFQTLSASLSFDGEAGASNANEYVLTLHSQQPLRVRQVDANTIELVVVGDWEIEDLLHTVSALQKARKQANSLVCKV